MAKIEVYQKNVDLITTDTQEFYLIGTAHISPESVELVEELIKELKPDSVAVELCEPRLNALSNPDRWREMDLVEVIKEGRSSILLAQAALSAFQQKLGLQLKVKPGAEMMRAVELAKEQGAELVLADREVRITLRRVWRRLSWWNRSKLLGAIVSALFSKQPVSKEEIERLKESDILDQAMAEFSEAFPSIKEPLISERDLFLCEKIRNAPGKRVVAVVGAGHCPGIKRSWEQSIDLEELNEIPPESWSSRLISWGLPALLILGLLYFSSFESVELGWHSVWIWCLLSGTLAATGSLICIIHPITAVVAVLTAPVTSLIPILRPGLVAGLVQARILKPRVSDLEGMMSDITSIRGCYSNRVVHTLLIVLVINALAKLAIVAFPILLLTSSKW